jgi:hypothetical protein
MQIARTGRSFFGLKSPRKSQVDMTTTNVARFGSGIGTACFGCDKPPLQCVVERCVVHTIFFAVEMSCRSRNVACERYLHAWVCPDMAIPGEYGFDRVEAWPLDLRVNDYCSR